RHRDSPDQSPAVHRKTDRAADHLCRPGGDRDRERAAVRGRAGADARAGRGAGAADCDLRSPRHHQQFAGRSRTRVRGDARERDAHLRGAIRHPVAFRRRRIPTGGPAWGVAALAKERRREMVWRPHAEAPLARLAGTKRIVHIADITSEPGYLKGYQPVVSLADLGGARTLLLVPMLKKDDLVGAIAIYRQEVRPFTEKQIGLVASFASQAVIAIENAR